MTSSRRFKDHFSDVAAAYAAHRPSYPAGLVDFLARLAPAKRLAWDSGCGSGQLSVLLAGPFARVVATDASPEQIAQAAVHPKVEYRCTRAEASGLPERVADLATAAQAVHWFDLPAYYAEVRRVARPDGIVAVISYGVVTADADLDGVIQPFYRNVLGSYWPPERRHVDDGYRSLPFPFEELAAPAFEIRLDWRLDDLIGYVATWSAVWALEQAEGQGPLGRFRRDLEAAWGPATVVRTVRWPLALRVGRV
ncbi:MAG: SAM-dependent methyltransferase [Gemmatimonadetes bacterium 13_1_40CM_4_69_8]|nr:MAG: SAM-dependent methyltransferase [Gemmatimonadetes bacterium 13_1_40CM_4_69_8]